MDLSRDRGRTGVLVRERADDAALGRAHVDRRVFADLRIARDRRREVVGEALVHRAGRVDRAARIDVPRAELEGRVDDRVTELVIDDVAVVRVVALRPLTEPERAGVEAVELLEELAEPAVGRREERVLERLERNVRIPGLRHVAARHAGGHLEVRDQPEGLVDDDLGFRLSLERAEERIGLRGVEVDRHLRERVLASLLATCRIGGLIDEVAVPVGLRGLDEIADVHVQCEAEHVDRLHRLPVDAVRRLDERIRERRALRRHRQLVERHVRSLRRIELVHVRLRERDQVARLEDLAGLRVDDHARAHGDAREHGRENGVRETGSAIERRPHHEMGILRGRAERHPRRRNARRALRRHRRVHARGELGLEIEHRRDRLTTGGEANRCTTSDHRQPVMRLRVANDRLTISEAIDTAGDQRRRRYLRSRDDDPARARLDIIRLRARVRSTELDPRRARARVARDDVLVVRARRARGDGNEKQRTERDRSPPKDRSHGVLPRQQRGRASNMRPRTSVLCHPARAGQLTERTARTDVLLNTRKDAPICLGLERIPIRGTQQKNISIERAEKTRRADEKALRALSSLDVGLRTPASPEAVI